MCLLLAPHFLSFFLAVTINSTSEANEAGGTRHYAVYITQMSMTTTDPVKLGSISKDAFERK